jgi:HEPN domain-containing protein
MDSQTRTLLKKSAEDEQILFISTISDAIAAFHAQQAVEKLMKALLAGRGIDYPKIHDLNWLRARLESVGEVFPATPVDFAEFTPFATVWRYDDPPDEVVLDRAKATETVRILREFVEKRVAEIEGQV